MCKLVLTVRKACISTSVETSVHLYFFKQHYRQFPFKNITIKNLQQRLFCLGNDAGSVVINSVHIVKFQFKYPIHISIFRVACDPLPNTLQFMYLHNYFYIVFLISVVFLICIIHFLIYGYLSKIDVNIFYFPREFSLCLKKEVIDKHQEVK